LLIISKKEFIKFISVTYRGCLCSACPPRCTSMELNTRRAFSHPS